MVDRAATPAPRRMILRGAVIARRYRLLAEAPAHHADAAIPCATWLAHREAGESVDGLGVIIAPDSEFAALRAHLAAIPFVAIHFPQFTDGRGYSHARRLRAHWDYRGIILAFGDVLRDQLVPMSRVGIDAFYMREDQDLEASLAAFGFYETFYQYGEPRPDRPERGRRDRPTL